MGDYKNILLLISISLIICIIINLSINLFKNHVIENFYSVDKVNELEKPNMSLLRIKGLDENIIHEYPNFIDCNTCDNIINYCSSKVKDSQVVCAGGNNCFNNDYRTSKNTFITDNESDAANLITIKVEKILGIDRSHFEQLQVVHYGPGKQYKEHWDACVSEYLKDCDRNVENSGQRYATFIIYLNDNYGEGETCFPRLNGNKEGYCNDKDALKIVPKKGKGVLFFNLTEDGILAKNESMHAGLPPSYGEKWMCNKWIRTKKLIN